MIRKYFLASNSANGFFSLYGTFPPGNAYLHIIKGGPGTGKSSFMRAIGAQAEKRGYRAEYVLCSGDPSSLDGVYIPELSCGWMDGTAPHAAEPTLFGVSGDYVNLGSFCKTPLPPDDAAEAARLNAKNKACYASAYKLLSEAGAARADKRSPRSEWAEARRIFMSAISREGKTELYDTVLAGFNEIDTSREDLNGMVSALKHSDECVFCLDPLLPGCVEAVIFPECRTFIRAAADDSVSDGIAAKAAEHIRAAGLAHDELEAIYKKYMDYSALNDFTAEYLKRIF